MGVGLSDGTSFTDNREWLAETLSAKQFSDRQEMAGNEASNDFQSRFLASNVPDTSGIPPEALRKAAGALKPTEGTQPPGDVEKVKWSTLFNPIDKPIEVSPGFNITPESVDTAINVGLAAGPGSMAGVKAATLNKAALYKAQNMELDAAHPDEIHEATGFFRGADSRWRFEIPDQNAKLKLENLDHRPATPDIMTRDNIYIGSQESVRIPGPKPIDEKSSLKDIVDFATGKSVEPLRLGDILDHPDLYKAYPELAYKPVKPLPKSLADQNIGGLARQDALYVATSHPDQFRSILLHEAQHYIQDTEGFARGGNQHMFEPEGLGDATSYFNKVRKSAESEIKDKLEEQMEYGSKMNSDTFVRHLKQNIENELDGFHTYEDANVWNSKNPEDYKRLKNIVMSERLLRQQSEKQYEQYMRLMGEVEARNVQTRMNYGQTERDLVPPYRTESRPRPVQIKYLK